MFFGGQLVAGFHIEQRKIGVDKLFLRAKFFGFMPLGNGDGKIACTIKRHAERELRIEMVRINRQYRFEFDNGVFKFTPAEIEHRIVVLFLQIHALIHATPIGRTVQARMVGNS